MLRKFFVLPVLSLFVLPAIASAQFEAGNWELTLSGSGTANKGVTSGNFGVNAGIGYFATKELELGLRQSVNYNDTETDGTMWTGSSRLFADYHFDFGKWQPFIGANGGFFYGDDTANFWEVGPEAGVKYFVNATTFVYGLVEYQFSTRDSDQSQFVYSLGLGFKF